MWFRGVICELLVESVILMIEMAVPPDWMPEDVPHADVTFQNKSYTLVAVTGATGQLYEEPADSCVRAPMACPSLPVREVLKVYYKEIIGTEHHYLTATDTQARKDRRDSGEGRSSWSRNWPRSSSSPTR